MFCLEWLLTREEQQQQHIVLLCVRCVCCWRRAFVEKASAITNDVARIMRNKARASEQTNDTRMEKKRKKKFNERFIVLVLLTCRVVALCALNQAKGEEEAQLKQATKVQLMLAPMDHCLYLACCFRCDAVGCWLLLVSFRLAGYLGEFVRIDLANWDKTRA